MYVVQWTVVRNLGMHALSITYTTVPFVYPEPLETQDLNDVFNFSGDRVPKMAVANPNSGLPGSHHRTSHECEAPLDSGSAFGQGDKAILCLVVPEAGQVNGARAECIWLPSMAAEKAGQR